MFLRFGCSDWSFVYVLKVTNRANTMTMLSETKLVVLDVETTGLSPAMGDRIVELGMITCNGATEIRDAHRFTPSAIKMF